MSRLDFAPKLNEIKVTDIENGLGVFTPKPEKTVSFARLKESLKKAGYRLAAAEITLTGRLQQDESGWWLVAEPTRQRFALAGPKLGELLAGEATGSMVEVVGDWQSLTSGAPEQEVITPKTIRKLGAARLRAPVKSGDWFDQTASFLRPNLSPALGFTPIRTTSPGLTVYRGGAFVPRYIYTRQHLGELKVTRQTLRLNFSYTPTPTVQIETEVPLQRTSFKESGQPATGAGTGWGNLTLWGKYRFFRTLETWGDRQAAVRVGVELPTGKPDAPGPAQLAAPAFVRQQLSGINSGWAGHADVSYSQAKGRFIVGGNLESIVRSDRAGFRLGHEVRLNTDLEYVLLPRKYRRPTRELFAILETTLVHRGLGRVNGSVVPGSGATEFYLAPALQYVATPRFLIEASYQFPVGQRTGPLALRTNHNLLLGIRYLY